jgi:hypothetical protein
MGGVAAWQASRWGIDPAHEARKSFRRRSAKPGSSCGVPSDAFMTAAQNRDPAVGVWRTDPCHLFHH